MNSKVKGPRAEACLVCLKMGQEPKVTGAEEQEGGRRRGDRGAGWGRADRVGACRSGKGSGSYSEVGSQQRLTKD